MPDLLEAPPVESIAPDTSTAPPDFGRCPVCNKPLYPRDRNTGQFREPEGSGYAARAKCGGCGTIIVYCGNKTWKVVSDGDLSEADREADRMDAFLGG